MTTTLPLFDLSAAAIASDVPVAAWADSLPVSMLETLLERGATLDALHARAAADPQEAHAVIAMLAKCDAKHTAAFLARPAERAKEADLARFHELHDLLAAATFTIKIAHYHRDGNEAVKALYDAQFDEMARLGVSLRARGVEPWTLDLLRRKLVSADAVIIVNKQNGFNGAMPDVLINTDNPYQGAYAEYSGIEHWESGEVFEKPYPGTWALCNGRSGESGTCAEVLNVYYPLFDMLITLHPDDCTKGYFDYTPAHSCWFKTNDDVADFLNELMVSAPDRFTLLFHS